MSYQELIGKTCLLGRIPDLKEVKIADVEVVKDFHGRQFVILLLGDGKKVGLNDVYFDSSIEFAS